MFFFFNDTATTEIYTLSLHDALPISRRPPRRRRSLAPAAAQPCLGPSPSLRRGLRVRRCHRPAELVGVVDELTAHNLPVLDLEQLGGGHPPDARNRHLPVDDRADRVAVNEL